MYNVINTYHLGVPSRERNSALLAVLVGDSDELEEAQRYRVYIGLVQLPDCESPTYQAEREKAAQWVAQCGTKQTYEKACAYFPRLDVDKYAA